MLLRGGGSAVAGDGALDTAGGAAASAEATYPPSRVSCFQSVLAVAAGGLEHASSSPASPVAEPAGAMSPLSLRAAQHGPPCLTGPL